MISKKLRDAFHATTRPIKEGDGMKNSEKLAWLSADSSNSVFIADNEGVGGQYVKWDTFKECSMEMDSDLRRKEWVQKLRDFAEELENYGKD